MRRLARRLRLARPEDVTAELVAEPTIDAMRERAAQLAPNTQGILLHPRAFFREGTSGSGPAELTSADLDRYHHRVAMLSQPSLLTWLHR